ncbi:MAG: FAD-dependent oxidoreductase [Peptococcaceae bacterium]|nr:FAD-dependent oxidoreductase [Peptococcaceae bacterium]
MSSLYSQGEIGKVELINRLVMAPMGMGYCEKGMITDRAIMFYRLRARGGVGLIVLGAMQIDPIHKTEYDMICLDDDRYIPGLRRLTDAVHDEGSKIFGQLLHQGRYARSKEYNGMEAVAPSAVFSRYTGETPRELTLSEITEMISYYAAGAKRLVQAGFDGVEICTNSGYLIGQFLSSVTNKRTDRYGGDLLARMTFLLEVVSAVRESVGQDFPISVRLGGSDFIEGGTTNKEVREIAVALEKAGVDAISITGGWHEAQVPQVTMEVPHGAFRYLGRRIKESVSIPVILSNRMNIHVAEEIMDEGNADFIAMARPFIAEPELAKKGMLGKYDEIRPCVACNQGCLDRIMAHTSVECLCNAEAGRESEILQGSYLPSQVKSSRPENILVVGAGIGGLEYARVAALRGHRVTIWEQSGHAGGQVEVASAPPGRNDFTYLVRYLTLECSKLGVEIEYQKKATKENILEQIQRGKTDRVVIATGAKPIQPTIPTEDGIAVVQAWDILKGYVKSGLKVVIVGGGAVGVETALKLAEIGTLDAHTLKHLMLYQAETPEELYYQLTHGSKRVTLVEMTKMIGKDIGATSRWSMIARLKQFHVDTLKLTKVIAIKKDGVVVEDQEGQKFIEADTVVLAVGSRAENSLYDELRNSLNKLDIIGDAVTPGKIQDAIRTAYDAAISV